MCAQITVDYDNQFFIQLKQMLTQSVLDNFKDKVRLSFGNTFSQSDIHELIKYCLNQLLLLVMSAN